ALLIVCALQTLRRWREGAPPPAAAAAAAAAPAAAAAMALLMLGAATARADDLPSSELLGELKEKLLRTAPCEPDCASAGRLLLEIDATTLKGRLEVGCGAE